MAENPPPNTVSIKGYPLENVLDVNCLWLSGLKKSRPSSKEKSILFLSIIIFLKVSMTLFMFSEDTLVVCKYFTASIADFVRFLYSIKNSVVSLNQSSSYLVRSIS